MSGIEDLVDKRGRKAPVAINLSQHRRLWEDFQDALLAPNRKSEPRESLTAVKQALLRQRKLSA